MNIPQNYLSAWLVPVCKVLYFLFPLPVAWLSLSLTSMYEKYYHIGVNPGANNGFLLYIVAPVLLVMLYATAVTSRYLTNRFLKSQQLLGMLLGGGLIVLVGVGAFAIQAWSYEDYPAEKPQNMALFLKSYLIELQGGC